MNVANHGKIASCLSTFPSRQSAFAQLAGKPNPLTNSHARREANTGERRRASLAMPHVTPACIHRSRASANSGASHCPEALRSAARHVTKPRPSTNSLCPARRRPPVTLSIGRTVSNVLRTRRCNGIEIIRAERQKISEGLISRTFMGLPSLNMTKWLRSKITLVPSVIDRPRGVSMLTMIMSRGLFADFSAIDVTVRSDSSAMILLSCVVPLLTSCELAGVVKKKGR